MMFVLQRGKKNQLKKSDSDNKLNSFNFVSLDQQVLRNQIHPSASHCHLCQAVPKTCHPRKGKTYSCEPPWPRRAAWPGWSPRPAACTGSDKKQKSHLLSLPAVAFCIPVLSRADQDLCHCCALVVVFFLSLEFCYNKTQVHNVNLT